jgi:hypothetical protein
MQVPSQRQKKDVQGTEDTGATQVQDNPPLPPFVPSQYEEEERQQAFVPPTQEQLVSLVAPTKKKRIKIRMKKR